MKMRFNNILARTGKKNGMVIFMCAVMLTVSLGTLVGCSVTKEDAEGASGQAEAEDAGNIESQAMVQPAEASEPVEKLAYIEGFDGETLVFDGVEWVQVPSGRAEALGITEDDAPSGFSVYNEEAVTEEMALAADCVCRLLDWTSDYAERQVTLEELADILEEREGTAIPYHITIKGNEITDIIEQYIP